MKSSTLDSSTVDNSTVDSSTVENDALDGSAVVGGSVVGGAVRGGTADSDVLDADHRRSGSEYRHIVRTAGKRAGGAQVGAAGRSPESIEVRVHDRGAPGHRDDIRAALAAVGRRGGSPRLSDDTGAATAEYAIATLAAVGFAGLLVVILRSEQVRGLLAGIIETALTVAG